jgi:hypothetical protein
VRVAARIVIAAVCCAAVAGCSASVSFSVGTGGSARTPTATLQHSIETSGLQQLRSEAKAVDETPVRMDSVGCARTTASGPPRYACLVRLTIQGYAYQWNVAGSCNKAGACHWKADGAALAVGSPAIVAAAYHHYLLGSIAVLGQRQLQLRANAFGWGRVTVGDVSCSELGAPRDGVYRYGCASTVTAGGVAHSWPIAATCGPPDGCGWAPVGPLVIDGRKVT